MVDPKDGIGEIHFPELRLQQEKRDLLRYKKHAALAKSGLTKSLLRTHKMNFWRNGAPWKGWPGYLVDAYLREPFGWYLGY
jgi:hypothetical protein